MQLHCMRLGDVGKLAGAVDGEVLHDGRLIIKLLKEIQRAGCRLGGSRTAAVARLGARIGHGDLMSGGDSSLNK